MYRILIPLAAAIIAAVLITSPGQASHGTKLTLTGKTLATEQIDVGKPGPSRGDMNVITEDVYRHGKRVGTSDIACTVVRIQPPKSFAAQCLNTTTLPGGQITAQGVVTSDQIEQVPFDHAITGGTGAYESAGGVLRVDEAGDGPATLTFRLD